MPDPANNDAAPCQAWWTTRRWFFLYLRGVSWRTLDVHRHPDCHRLSVQIGRFGFRWVW